MTDLGKRLLGLLTVVYFGSACASAQPRFRDAPPVWRVDDDQSIAEPEVREFDAKEYSANVFALQRIDRLLQLRDEELAGNLNSLEEVPDSTWFQNRIGVRAVKPREAARGVDWGGPPRRPFSIIGGKLGIGRPSFLLQDGTGRRFRVQFDTERNPELRTAAGVIVNRIFWTAGYNVASDHVFELRKDELAIAPNATYINAQKNERRMSREAIDAILFTAHRREDGVYRALASQLVPGIPKGGFKTKGQRRDDANDRVNHEHRRELRGLRVLAAWVAHTDIREESTLDVYVERNGRRFLRHYLVDFGEALSGHASTSGRAEDGWEHYLDWEMQTKATFAFGLWKRPWEDVHATPWPAVGSFAARPFDPTAWREVYPYWPFAEMDASDAYWAAKLVMRFDRPLLDAIVGEASLSEQAAATYLVDTLLARRDAIGKAYVEAVTSLDDFQLSSTQLCMTDLSVRYGFAKTGSVEWLSGSTLRYSLPLRADGRLCVRVPRGDAYTVFRMRVRRSDNDVRPAMELHFKAGERPRILGIVRVAR
ncbi:MAG TPA: hypothetical protein VIW29_01145 [Polyangiaceae bacterium]